MTKDYGLERVSGPLTYNDITSASPEGRRHIWTDRERDWEEAEALDTGQERPDVLYWMAIGCVRAKGGAWGRAGVDCSCFICHLTPWSLLLFSVLFVFSVARLNGCMMIE